MFEFVHAPFLIAPGPPHIADCQLESVSYTSATIDWLPLNTPGKSAPIDRYTMEVVHGNKIIQRIELRGSDEYLVLPNVLQPHTLYIAALFGTNGAGKGPPCHVLFTTSQGLHTKQMLEMTVCHHGDIVILLLHMCTYK